MSTLETAGTLIGMVLLYLFKEWQEKRKKKKDAEEMSLKLDANSKTMQTISSCLVRLQAYSGCSRVAIFEYSNGNYTHAGISMQYIDCTYEITDESTKPIIHEFKRISIAPYLNMISRISASTTGWTRIVENDDDRETRAMQQYWNIATAYSFRITAVVWDGVVGLNWIGKDVTLTQEEIEHINVEVMRIRDLMNQLKK